MKPRPKTRKAIKWGGTILVVLLVALCVVSRDRHISYLVGKRTLFFLAPGQVCLSESQLYGSEGWTYAKDLIGGNFGKSPFVEPYQWRFEYLRGYSEWSIRVPLWFPIALVLVPTALAWRFDILARRRARAGNCANCNYDCAGLVTSAPCPECGKTSTASPLSFTVNSL